MGLQLLVAILVLILILILILHPSSQPTISATPTKRRLRSRCLKSRPLSPTRSSVPALPTVFSKSSLFCSADCWSLTYSAMDQHWAKFLEDVMVSATGTE